MEKKQKNEFKWYWKVLILINAICLISLTMNAQSYDLRNDKNILQSMRNEISKTDTFIIDKSFLKNMNNDIKHYVLLYDRVYEYHVDDKKFYLDVFKMVKLIKFSSEYYYIPDPGEVMFVHPKLYEEIIKK